MIITIISPIRFKSEILDAYTKLSLAGNVVLLPVDLTDLLGETRNLVGENSSDELMNLHKKKIDMADKVLVLNVGGYMGRGTYEEIGYATIIGKEIEYLEPLQKEI